MLIYCEKCMTSKSLLEHAFRIRYRKRIMCDSEPNHSIATIPQHGVSHIPPFFSPSGLNASLPLFEPFVPASARSYCAFCSGQPLYEIDYFHQNQMCSIFQRAAQPISSARTPILPNRFKYKTLKMIEAASDLSEYRNFALSWVPIKVEIEELSNQ